MLDVVMPFQCFVQLEQLHRLEFHNYWQGGAMTVVLNDSAFTFSTKCQSLIAATTTFAITSPVPLGSLGTFKRCSTPRPETRIGKQSTFSWFSEISGSNFPSQ